MSDRSDDYSLTEHTRAHTLTRTLTPEGNVQEFPPDLIVDGQLFPAVIYLSKASALPSASESLTVLPAGPLMQIKQDGWGTEDSNYWDFVLKADQTWFLNKRKKNACEISAICSSVKGCYWLFSSPPDC